MLKRVAKARTKTKTLPYDVAAQLRTSEERAAYLDAWLAEAPDDVEGIAWARRDIARARGASKVTRNSSSGSEKDS